MDIMAFDFRDQILNGHPPYPVTVLVGYRLKQERPKPGLLPIAIPFLHIGRVSGIMQQEKTAPQMKSEHRLPEELIITDEWTYPTL